MKKIAGKILDPIRTGGIRWLGRKAFERAGYTWDLRRSGDLKIGMWRKNLRTRFAGRTASPKRFVLTPGFGDSPISWLFVMRLLIPALKRSSYDEIVMLDFPGFSGRLVEERCFPSMDLLMESTADVFDWLEPDTILGHSLGGWISARYAADCGAGKRPAVRKRHGYEGPRKLLLAASAGVYESDDVAIAVGELFAEAFGEKGFSALRPHLFAREPIWFEWVSKDFMRFATDPGIRQFFESIGEAHLLRGRLSDIRAQTSLIWGERDSMVPIGGIPAWLKGLDGTQGTPQAVLIKNVGHSPQVERPAVIADAISQILLGREPKGRGLKEITS
jgi:pimeloyl-ACP methyl ester carboxylesterase